MNPADGHAPYVDPPVRARCETCGWVGPVRKRNIDALADANQHELMEDGDESP